MDEKQIRYNTMYMDIAERISQMSYARRLKVGCIIIKNDNIISIGFNGMPSGWDNNCEDEIPELIDVDARTITPANLVTKKEVLHAEMNSISKLAKNGESSDGATMFITHAPCIDCAKSIYQSGIKHVYYKNVYRSTDGIDFLKKCKIDVKQI